ncbi:MAG: N-acetylmuramoyl-L-alanine amidase [Butyricicoccaceae bacterium]
MKQNKVILTALAAVLAVSAVSAGCILYSRQMSPAAEDTGSAQTAVVQAPQESPQADTSEHSTAAQTSESEQQTEQTPASDLPESEYNPGHAEPAAELDGFTVCIDPGHASSAMTGQEPISPLSEETKLQCTGGTSGDYQTEAELNLKMALMLRDRLTELGANVVLTRSSADELISNVERATIANEAQADLCIRLHADGSENTSIRGISMLIPSGSLLGTPEIAKPSAEAGRVVLDSVIQATGAQDRGTVQRSDLTGFNWSEVPCILIEMGFMSNPEDDKLLASETYQEKLCSGMAEGIRRWLLKEF